MCSSFTSAVFKISFLRL